jgi:transcription initiation factor TFIIA large subunit
MGVKQEQDFAQGDPNIKQEPGMQPMPQGYNPPNGARPTAAHRAALALESQYGQRAAASISAIHSGMASQANPALQPQQQGQRPAQPPQHMSQQQYRQGVAATMQQRMQQVPGQQRPPNGLPTTQLDGSSEAVDGPSLEPGSGAAQPPIMDRAQIDAQFHAQIAARAKQMEGGGLMLPLEEATKIRGVAGKARGDGDGPSQLDGMDDDIKSEDDEDAINSDLDDPDDVGDDDDDDDDTMGHMMLCMYDKVQRVKNKWCVCVYRSLLSPGSALLTPLIGSASSRTACSP